MYHMGIEISFIGGNERLFGLLRRGAGSEPRAGVREVSIGDIKGLTFIIHTPQLADQISKTEKPTMRHEMTFVWMFSYS